VQGSRRRGDCTVRGRRGPVGVSPLDLENRFLHMELAGYAACAGREGAKPPQRLDSGS